MAKRLTGSELTDFLGNIGIERVEPVGKVPASGENLNDQALEELSKKGDPVTPTKGMILEDPLTLARLFNDHKGDVCFPLTPDGHLKSHVPPPTESDTDRQSNRHEVSAHARRHHRTRPGQRRQHAT